MKLLLARTEEHDDCTIGKLHVGGSFFCYTIEPADRRVEDGNKKIPGKTAIPRGTYKVKLAYSVRDKKLLPLIMNVPKFSEVRIGEGNYADGIEGRIAVGYGHKRGDVFVTESKPALDELYNLMAICAVSGEEVTLEVR